MQATETSIQDLWSDYTLTRSESLRNEIVEHYLPLVNKIVDAIMRKNPKADRDDLRSNGVIGLMQAVEAFDVKRGFLFETYAPPRIRGAIIDDIRTMDIVPRLTRSREKVRKCADAALTQQLGRAPTDEEILASVGDKVANDSVTVGFCSIDKTFGGASESYDNRYAGKQAMTMADDSVVPPHDALDRKDALDFILKHLARDERLIIILYYKVGMTMKEIGRTLELSESRVSQLHSNIIDKLRARRDIDASLLEVA